MAITQPPILDEVSQDPVAIESALSKLGGVLNTFSKDLMSKASKTVGSAASSVTEKVIESGLGPISAMVKPFESVFGFNAAKSITSLFSKAGTGLFGTGKDFRGPLNETTIKKVDPGAAFLGRSFKDALDKSQKSKEEGGEFLSRFMKLLTGGGLIAGAIALFMSGLTDEGPFKGLKKLIGKFIRRLGVGIIRRLLSPFAEFFDTLIKPLRGWLDNILKPFKGFIDNILKPFKGLLDFFLKPFKSLFDNILKFGGRVLGRTALGGGIKRLFKPIVDFIAGKATKLFKALKFMPGIGTIVGVGFAISRFKQGDVVGGILELVSALADAFPGVGTAISWGLDIFLAARDMGAFQEGGVIKANLTDIFKGIWEWIKTKGKKIYGIMATAIGGILTGAFEWIKDKFKSAWDISLNVRDKIREFIGGIFDSLMEHEGVHNFITGAQELKDTVLTFLRNFFSGAWERITTALDITSAWVQEHLFTPIKEFAIAFWDRVKTTFFVASDWINENILNPIGSIFRRVMTKVTEVWTGTTAWVNTNVIDPIKEFFTSVVGAFARLRLQVSTMFGTIAGKGAATRNQRSNAFEAFENVQGLDWKALRDAAGRIQANNPGIDLGEAMYRIFQENQDAFASPYTAAMLNSRFTEMQDGIISRNGELFRTHPNDTIIATQNPVARQTETQSINSLSETNTAFREMSNQFGEAIRQLSEVLKESSAGNQVIQQNNTYTSRFSPGNVMSLSEAF